jgi:hypothetical protein
MRADDQHKRRTAIERRHAAELRQIYPSLSRPAARRYARDETIAREKLVESIGFDLALQADAQSVRGSSGVTITTVRWPAALGEAHPVLRQLAAATAERFWATEQ